jgi:hypothetical protein
MKIANLFNLITDVKDFLDLFTGIYEKDQLITRLDRLKRQAPDDVLSCIEGLRADVTAALDDTIEMSPSLDEDDVSDAIDAEIEALQKMDTATEITTSLEPSTAGEANSAAGNAAPAEKNTVPASG